VCLGGCGCVWVDVWVGGFHTNVTERERVCVGGRVWVGGYFGMLRMCVVL
jgi:hypothetical protein